MGTTPACKHTWPVPQRQAQGEKPSLAVRQFLLSQQVLQRGLGVGEAELKAQLQQPLRHRSLPIE